jgi:hypothetical protein
VDRIELFDFRELTHSENILAPTPIQLHLCKRMVDAQERFFVGFDRKLLTMDGKGIAVSITGHLDTKILCKYIEPVVW